MELYQILYAVHTGTMPKIPRSMKNKVNAILADQINVGDIVRVIATGKIGRVNRKIPYDRTSQEFFFTLWIYGNSGRHRRKVEKLCCTEFITN